MVKIDSCMIWLKNILVVKFFMNSTSVILGSNTKNELNYETITLSTCLYFLLKNLKIALNFYK